jgi:hypothetical protein
MSTEEYEPPSERAVDEPDFVADHIVCLRNSVRRRHRDDFRVYFDGFDFVTFVDTSIPIHRHDEILAFVDGELRAHGIVADSRQYENETEFYTIPFTEEIEAM